MTFFSGLKISLEKYPISERPNAVFPTQSNFIPEYSPLTRFPDRGLYHSNCAVLERSAEDRFKAPEIRFISHNTRIEHREARFESNGVSGQINRNSG